MDEFLVDSVLRSAEVWALEQAALNSEGDRARPSKKEANADALMVQAAVAAVHALNPGDKGLHPFSAWYKDALRLQEGNGGGNFDPLAEDVICVGATLPPPLSSSSSSSSPSDLERGEKKKKCYVFKFRTVRRGLCIPVEVRCTTHHHTTALGGGENVEEKCLCTVQLCLDTNSSSHELVFSPGELDSLSLRQFILKHVWPLVK
jgi:hypothetical protein